jgi:hypothetical protein
MPKPNGSWNVKQLKDYVRAKGLNKPEIKLGMKKADLVKGLKKHGHWEKDPKLQKLGLGKVPQKKKLKSIKVDKEITLNPRKGKRVKK